MFTGLFTLGHHIEQKMYQLQLFLSGNLTILYRAPDNGCLLVN